MNFPFSTAITRIILKSADFAKNASWLNPSIIVKYPIFLTTLLSRIRSLATLFKDHIKLDLRSYPMTPEGKLEAQKDLAGLGGIYIWWSQTTGYFYLGSALSFFGKNGRLTKYFWPSRINTPGTVNKDLAKDFQRLGYSDFTLIIVQIFPTFSISQNDLFKVEQIWMLLLPTYNRTLLVGAPVSAPMTEADRAAMSTPIHSYEVIDGKICEDSHQIHYGLKQLARTGYTSTQGAHIPISLFLLYELLNSGSLCNNLVLFTKTEITDPSAWTASQIMKAQATAISYDRTNTHGVWTYTAHIDPNYVYTKEDLVSYYQRVDLARTAYNIPGTTFQRIRKLLSPHKGLIHSNTPLHNDTKHSLVQVLVPQKKKAKKQSRFATYIRQEICLNSSQKRQIGKRIPLQRPQLALIYILIRLARSFLFRNKQLWLISHNKLKECSMAYTCYTYRPSKLGTPPVRKDQGARSSSVPVVKKANKHA